MHSPIRKISIYINNVSAIIKLKTGKLNKLSHYFITALRKPIKLFINQYIKANSNHKAVPIEQHKNARLFQFKGKFHTQNVSACIFIKSPYTQPTKY